MNLKIKPTIEVYVHIQASIKGIHIDLYNTNKDVKTLEELHLALLEAYDYASKMLEDSK